MQIQPGVCDWRFPRRHLPPAKVSALFAPPPAPPISRPILLPPQRPPLPSLSTSRFPLQCLPVPPFLPSPPLSYPSSLFSASLSGSRSLGKPGADRKPEHDLRTRRSCAGSARGSEVPGCSVPLPSRPRLLLGAAALCKCPARAARWGSWPEGLAGGLARSAPARVLCLSVSPASPCLPCLPGPLPVRSPAQPGTACYPVASRLAPHLPLGCSVRT